MILFYNSYGKIFTSDILSLSTIVSLVFLFLLIFIPLFIAYSTEDFWQRLKICQEQPYVKLNKKFFISTLEENSDVYSSKFYTSSNEINSQLLSLADNENDYLLKGVTIGISNIDENGDSFNDKIEIKISFIPTTTLKNIKMMFFFDYYLIKKARFYTESMMYLDIDTPNGENRLILNGELKLKQKSPIAQMSLPRVIKDDYLFGIDRESPYDMLALYNKYSSKNITTKFEGDIFLSRYNVENNGNGNNKVDITLNVYIPKSQDVLYYASVAETIKEAWIQYIYLFIPIYFLIHFILGFILRNRVFPCSVQSDIEGDVQDIY